MNHCIDKAKNPFVVHLRNCSVKQGRAASEETLIRLQVFGMIILIRLQVVFGMIILIRLQVVFGMKILIRLQVVFGMIILIRSQ